jgi:hypothetical protein
VSQQGSGSFVAAQPVVGQTAPSPTIRVHRSSGAVAVRWPGSQRWLAIDPPVDERPITVWREAPDDELDLAAGRVWVDPPAAAGHDRQQHQAAVDQTRRIELVRHTAAIRAQLANTTRAVERHLAHIDQVPLDRPVE